MPASEPITCLNGAHLSARPTLTAAPGTDIASGTGCPSRCPYAFSAPLIYHALRTSAFQRSRATFRCRGDGGGYAVDLDQAGLILVWPRAGLPAPSAAEPGRDADTAPNYVMAGLEGFRGRVMRSCVANAGGVLDWSTWPVGDVADAPGRAAAAASATVELVRVGERLVVVFAVKGADGEEQRVLFRTVGWCFQPREPDEVVWVGFFAARPDWDGEAREGLQVDIEEFVVQSHEGVLKVV